MIGSDFKEVELPYTRYCGECGRKMLKGYLALASIRGGKVRKYVCCEDCRLTFDDKFWRGVAAERRAREGR